MTLSSTISKQTYAGDGATTSFPIPFLFLDNAHIEAVLRDGAGVETVWSENTHYTLDGAGEQGGGTLTVLTSPADHTPQPGESLVIRRVVAATQETDYPEGGAFPAVAHETALDKLTMLVQQHDEQLARALRFPVSDPAALSAETPGSLARANRFLAFDAAGTPIAAAGQVGGTPVSPFMATLLDDTTAAVARGTLGISLTGVDLHIRDFGAVGNGVADDTAAFTAAIAALQPGQRLRVAIGTYIVTGIVFDRTGVLHCERGAVLKLKDGQASATKLLTIAADDVLVIGGTFNGNRAGQTTPTDQNCIFSDGRTGVHIDVDRVTGAGGDGVYMANATDCSVRVRKGDDTGLNGILWTYTGSGSLTRCITWDSFIDRSDDAANDQGCIKYAKSGAATGQIVGCAIVNCRAKMHSAPTGSGVGPIEIWGAGTRNRIIGCDVEGGTIGISIANGQSRSIVAGCTAYDCDYIGIEIADSTHCTVVGNIIEGNGNTEIGISIDGATNDARSTSVVGNAIRDVSTKGISFYLGAPGSVASGNSIDISGPSSFSIYILASPKIVVNANSIDGNSVAHIGIVIDKCSDILLAGNSITNFAAQAIEGVQDTPGTMDNVSIVGGLIANTGYMQFIASGGGVIGNNIAQVNTVGWAVGTTSIGLAYGDVYDWKNFRGYFRVSGGDPEGQLIAGPGSICIRTDGVPGSQLWVKESGTGTEGWRPQDNASILEVAVSHSDLAAGAAKVLVAGIAGGRFKVRHLRLSGAGTNFSGGGGNRDIAIQDASGSTIWSVLSAAKLQMQSATDWGQAGVPFPAIAAHLTAASVAGDSIIAKYTGGSADYTAGSLTLIIEYERVI